MRYFVLILLIPLALSAQAKAPPPTPAADLATLEGKVFHAVAGTPLPKATVTMNRMNRGPIAPGARNTYSATTDASGRYAITGIEPGTYRLNADHTGFLNMQYNAPRPEASGSTLDLGRAQRMTGVDFRLTPHGVITGKIIDEDGDPMQRVQIQIMRVVYNSGRKQLAMTGGDSTNDLGEYRLFGISPGKYYLCATYGNQRMMVAVDQPPAQEDYVPTFFPGVTDISAATLIEVGPGDQVQGINMRLTKMHTARISGRVADNTAPPPPAPEPVAGRGGTVETGGGGVSAVTQAVNGQMIRVSNQNFNPRIQLRLQPRGPIPGMMGMMNNAQVRVDGTFEFPSVPPGAYYLLATSAQAGRGQHGARQAIDVGNNNIEGINLAINPGVTVTGHVRYDGDAPQPLPSLTMRLTPREPGANMPAPLPAKVDANGDFRFEDVNPDDYTVNINTPPKLYLKSLRGGSADVMVSGLDLSNGAATLDILLGTNPPQVGGSVVNSATGQAAVGVTVVLMPREKERQGESYFYSTTNTDQQGNFTFPRVTPGDYQVYAWEDVSYGQWFDPEFMKAYEGKGESLSAQENSPANVKLTMIPAK